MTFFSHFTGLGGTVKQLAACASLQRPYNDQLITSCQLFDWACSNIPAAYFGYCSNEDYAREQSSLERRFQISCTILGTRKLGCHYSKLLHWNTGLDY